ncbi:hypothetical protein BJV78DRAFT_1227134 [Lactifluus subvellereus]|nr:hypothetical protein BJV78DRAFT_1227134 [Lactifluus subvellereus]
MSWLHPPLTSASSWPHPRVAPAMSLHAISADQDRSPVHRKARLGDTARRAPMRRGWTAARDGQALADRGPARQQARGCAKVAQVHLPPRERRLCSLFYHWRCAVEVGDARVQRAAARDEVDGHARPSSCLTRVRTSELVCVKNPCLKQSKVALPTTACGTWSRKKYAYG